MTPRPSLRIAQVAPLLGALTAIGLVVACNGRPPPARPATAVAAQHDVVVRREAPKGPTSDAAPPASPDPPPDPPPPPPDPPRAVGPYEIPFGAKRTVYFAVPPHHAPGQRLIANLHGMCNPPGYACGYWVHAGSERGFLVCPAGNSECGPGVSTWTESWDKIDADLEASISAVDAEYPGEIDRGDGGVLTGFSLGASVAPLIAEKHPGRWPYLVIMEATVALDAKKLREAGVRAVALVAGELGANVYSDKAIADALNKQGFPARVWIMPKVGHWYSANIDEIMGEAIDWMLAQS